MGARKPHAGQGRAGAAPLALLAVAALAGLRLALRGPWPGFPDPAAFALALPALALAVLLPRAILAWVRSGDGPG